MRNGSGGRAAGLYTLVKPDVTGSTGGVRIIIPAYLIKQRSTAECTCKRIPGLNKY